MIILNNNSQTIFFCIRHLITDDRKSRSYMHLVFIKQDDNRLNINDIMQKIKIKNSLFIVIK
jgi:hypothetical protein